MISNEDIRKAQHLAVNIAVALARNGDAFKLFNGPRSAVTLAEHANNIAAHLMIDWKSKGWVETPASEIKR